MQANSHSPAPAPAFAAPAPPEKKVPQFDGVRAFEQLKKQVEFGPRPVGLPAHERCGDYLVATLKQYAPTVERQEFQQRVGGKQLPMTNVIAKWGDASKHKNGVILAAHWDTRPSADEEIDPANRRKPILGANDGASGVAVLLEAARLFKATPPPVPVWIVLFDGEDYGPGIEAMFLGAKHFARHLPADAPRQGILLDMVGDKDLRIPQEQYSRERAPQVIASVYDVAHRKGYGMQFPKEPGGAVLDDHLPLLQRGVQMIDLIDFDYAPWHTLEDTVDKCSPNSLRIVGDVVVSWVFERG